MTETKSGAVLGLVFGAVMAVSAASGDKAPPTPAPAEPIRVISSSHRIDFPQEVFITLEAEADAEIVEVTLFYRLGSRNVRVYGYPSFTPSTRVTADFRIDTGGQSFIPVGVDIEYFYVLRDALDNTLESERFVLEYKDPSYQWRTVQQGDLTVLWHDRPMESVLEAIKEASERTEPVKALLGLEGPVSMKAVILNSGREARRSFPFVSQTATQSHLFGGFAFGELDVFVLAGLDPDGMAHEMTHLLIDEALDSPLARVPTWLNEGLAMYFESGERQDRTIASPALRGSGLLSLRAMNSVPGRPEDVRTFYAQSRSVVAHMMDAYGDERMAALLVELKAGAPLDSAIQRAYGIGLDELESEWRTRLAAETSLAPVTDLSTVGTSLLIAAAAALAASVAAYRWLRRRGPSPGAEDADG